MSFTSNHNEWIWFRTKWFIWEMSNSTRLQLHSMKLRHISWSARFGSIVSKPTHIAVYDLVLALFLLWQSYSTVPCTMAFALKKKKKNLNEYTSEEAKKKKLAQGVSCFWFGHRDRPYFLLFNEYNILSSFFFVIVVVIVSINIDAFFRLQLIWNCVKFIVSCHIQFVMSFFRLKKKTLSYRLGNVYYEVMKKKGEILKWL